jgi:hypothetical protein
MIVEIRALRVRYVEVANKDRARENAQALAQLQARAILKAWSAEGKEGGIVDGITLACGLSTRPHVLDRCQPEAPAH